MQIVSITVNICTLDVVFVVVTFVSFQFQYVTTLHMKSLICQYYYIVATVFCATVVVYAVELPRRYTPIEHNGCVAIQTIRFPNVLRKWHAIFFSMRMYKFMGNALMLLLVVMFNAYHETSLLSI